MQKFTFFALKKNSNYAMRSDALFALSYERIKLLSLSICINSILVYSCFEILNTACSFLKINILKEKDLYVCIIV
jgi:hypothetical protein